MKMDAIRHQGARSDLTSDQVGPKLTAAEKVAMDAGDSQTQVKRFVRLTNLIPEIRDMVDTKQIAFNPAVELSYLKPEEQREFLDAMDYAQAAPSLSQAQRIKKLSQDGGCELDAMRNETMFGCLKHYMDAAFWQENPSVTIANEDGTWQYDIYAAYEVGLTAETYRQEFSSPEEKQDFIQYGLEQSVIDTGITPTPEDTIITLSTCSGSSRNTRWVVQAVRI